MGANQSAGRPSGPRSIPVRPRTPLRFGSVPTALPVDPAEYNTRPIRNLYPSIAPADSVTSLLSQENYLCPPPLSPTITEEEEDAPSPASWTTPTRYHCPHPNCAYSVIGFSVPEELDMHLQTDPAHFPQSMLMDYTQSSPQMPPTSAYMMETDQQCACASCTSYQDWSIPRNHQPLDYTFHHHQMHQAQQQQQQQLLMHPMMHMQRQMAPMIVGYNGPEVENLNWSGERIPKSHLGAGYPPLKRQRLDFA